MKALVFTTKINLEALASLDTRVIAYGLERAGYEVDLRSLADMREDVDAVPFEDYDLIGYTIPDNALYSSTAKNYRFYTEMVRRAKSYAITLFQCDVTFALDPFIWDPSQGRAETRHNYLEGVPVRVVASFSDAILEDPVAMELMESKYMRKLHRDSLFIPVEWLSFNYDFNVLARGGESGGDLLALPKPPIEGLITPDPSELPVNKFYYGIKKPKIARRLKELGLGDDPQDALFGRVGDGLPAVRNFLKDKKSVGRQFWVPYARAAKEVLIPYEPIKGDYQITLRFLEALDLYPDSVSVDPSHAEFIQDAAQSIAPWLAAQERAKAAYEALSS